MSITNLSGFETFSMPFKPDELLSYEKMQCSSMKETRWWIMINWCSDKLIYCEFFMHLWESWKYANAQNVHDREKYTKYVK